MSAASILDVTRRASPAMVSAELEDIAADLERCIDSIRRVAAAADKLAKANRS